MTAQIKTWFHVTDKIWELLESQRYNQMTDFFPKVYLHDAYGYYRFSFTLQNTGDWEKVLELFFPSYYLEHLSEWRVIGDDKDLPDTESQMPSGNGRRGCGKKSHTVFTIIWNNGIKRSCPYTYMCRHIPLSKLQILKGNPESLSCDYGTASFKNKKHDPFFFNLHAVTFCNLFVIWNQNGKTHILLLCRSLLLQPRKDM